MEQRKSKCFIFELSPKPQLQSFIKPFAIFRLHRYTEKNYRILGSGLSILKAQGERSLAF